MQIRESAEDYLETVLMLQQRLGYARSIDVAAELGFSKPSVSVAMKKFRENGLVEFDDKGYISLTDAGRMIAERTLEKHNLLAGYLIGIGVSEKTAREDACRIEHALSTETFEKIKEFAAAYKEKRQ
ncbi:MAG TPA: metal-dependent transcriptional regulator [Clostridia bacterium]|nr:metal-dependent transcriptional regulator [Clostridia bacterium]